MRSQCDLDNNFLSFFLFFFFLFLFFFHFPPQDLGVDEGLGEAGGRARVQRRPGHHGVREPLQQQPRRPSASTSKTRREEREREKIKRGQGCCKKKKKMLLPPLHRLPSASLDQRVVVEDGLMQSRVAILRARLNGRAGRQQQTHKLGVAMPARKMQRRALHPNREKMKEKKKKGKASRWREKESE